MSKGQWLLPPSPCLAGQGTGLTAAWAEQGDESFFALVVMQASTVIVCIRYVRR